MRRFALIALVCGPVFGQADRPFSAGVMGGIPLTPAFESSPGFFYTWSPATKYYAVGPAVEVRLPRRFAIELDALYHRLNYSSYFLSSSPSAGLLFFNSSTAANRWDFPLLLKYRFRKQGCRPFLEAGGAANYVGGVHQSVVFGSRDLEGFVSLGRVSYDHATELGRTTRFGIVSGAGIEFRAAVFRVSPQLRYTRWTKENIEAGDMGHKFFGSNLNQVEFLLGVTF